MIDKNSEHYQQFKTTVPRNELSEDEGGAGDSEQDSEEEQNHTKNAGNLKPRNHNNLFANKEDDDSDNSGNNSDKDSD